MEEEEDSTQHSSILLKNIEHGWMDGWMPIKGLEIFFLNSFQKSTSLSFMGF
jgi:hypothetical protein